MNILAHSLLSEKNEDWLLGNFMADGLSRKHWGKFSEGVQTGLLLHHVIDGYTDAHDLVKYCVSKLRISQNRYAPVVVDVLFDHYLARNFSQFSNESLNDYSAFVYSALQLKQELMTEKKRMMLKYMSAQHWLESYAEWNGFLQALAGMARRTRFPSEMEKAGDDILPFYYELESVFMAFFPMLREKTRLFLKL